MPAFGFSAVPSPAKTRKTLPGCHPPSAAAEATGTSPPEPDCNHDNNGGPNELPDPAARTTATRGTTGVDAVSTDPADRTPLGAAVSTATEDPAEITGAGASASRISGVTADGRTDGNVGVRCRVVAAGSGSCPRERVDEPARSAAESARGAAPRSARRGGTRALVDADADAAPDPGSAALEPVDPAEPVVSADANGIAATAEPTPRATARAPTRPTYRANPVAAGSTADTDRRRYSIDRIRPGAVRRC